MNRTVFFLTTGLLAVFLGLQASGPGPASAGAPLKINYQGRLEESGQPAEGFKNFVFKIYDALSGGSLVWTSQLQSVAVYNGIFSVTLETGAAVNLSTAVFSGARYVEISVNGVPLAPRQEMVSAPYALVAQALSSDAKIALSNLEKDPSAPSTINVSTNPLDWTQLKNVPSGLANGTDGTGAVIFSTAAIVSGKFGDERVTISTGAFYGGFNGPDQLARLDGAGKLSAAQVAAGVLGDSVVASSVAVDGVYREAIRNGAVNDAKVTLSTAAISAGKFGDDRVAISTGAFYGGFNGPDQLARLDGSGKLAAGTSFAGSVSLPIKTITSAVSPYTLTADDSTVLVNAAGGQVLVNLPSAAGLAGRVYTVKLVDATNPAKLIPSGTETMEGWAAADPYTLDARGDFAAFQSDGANWLLISAYSMALNAGGLWY